VENLIKRTWRELNEEISYITHHLRRWWNGMEDGEQLFFVGILCASCLLLGLRRPSKGKYKHYDDKQTIGLIQQFMFAAVVLVIFTFGIDIAINSV
jgi:hypothetical protein